MAEPQRLFLSYARGDDEPFVERLYHDLTRQGFHVWWDRECMPSRGLTFLQEIRDAIEASDRLLAVIGPWAVRSDYVTSEWQHALLFAKGVVPLLRLGDYQLVPPELKKLHTLDFRSRRWTFWSYRKGLRKLTRILRKPLGPRGDILGVPGVPPHFLPRLAEIQGLQNKILADIQRPIAITSARQTTGLVGIGGIGKSVLAAALARSTDTRRAFPDGIIWLTLGAGEDGKQYDPLANLRALGLALGDREGWHYQEVQTARNRLHQVLAAKVCLIILDDVWEMDQATPFRSALGPRGRLLLTTRQRGLVSSLEAQEHCLDLLSAVEARNLLAGWCNLAPAELPPEAASVARECGHLPLALAICGALARRGELWGDLLHNLQNADLAALGASLPDYPYDNAYKAMHVSVAYLVRRNPAGAGHYRELAVFPADEAAPETAVLTLWTTGNGLSERQGRRLLAELADLGLITLAGEAPHRRVSMHDLQHDYLRARAGDDLQGLHERLLSAYEAKCPDGWFSGPDDGYFFQRLPAHLLAAGHEEELRAQLLDYHWLRAKLAATDVTSLRRDYLFLEDDKALQTVSGALQLSAHVLFRYPDQLPSQLTGRLLEQQSSSIREFLEQVRKKPRQPWLRPLTPTLTTPGGPLLATIKMHKDSVIAVALTPDGRRAVCGGSAEGTLIVLDLENGGELQTLRGRKEEVNAVAVSPDGRRAVSGSEDRTLKVWDLESGKELHTLRGHKEEVNAVAVSPDGRRAVSGSWDETLKVWDLETGEELQTLRGHEGPVEAVALSPDGRLAVSASRDRTLKVWDLETGEELQTLSGHNEEVNAVAVTPDGRRAVSGTDNGP